MNLKLEGDPSAVNAQQWEEFVRAHPQGNIFQTPGMLRVYRSTGRYEPIFIACHDGSSLRGILLAVVQREGRGILGRLSARSIIWGGPLVLDEDEAVLDAVMTEYDRRARKEAIYTQVRNLFPGERRSERLQARGYSYEDHLDILVDLDRPVEALWKGMHPTRRKQIERGYRRGAVFSFHRRPGPEIVSECYGLISALYGRIRLPFPGMDFFESASRELSDHIGFFVLKHQGRIIGCRLVLVHGRLIYDWYAGSDDGSLDKYPNDILPWEVMKWGAENGFNLFQFGGAGKPGIPYGVREHKLKFGGSLVNYGRLKKIHKPASMAMARLGLRLWQKLP